MTDVAHVDARLNSLFEPGFTSEDRVLMDAKGVTSRRPEYSRQAPPVTIHDGRELQRQATGERVLHRGRLLRRTQLRPSRPFLRPSRTGIPTLSVCAGGKRISPRIYYPEITTIIRERLLPGHRLEIPQVPYLLRRGPETPNPFYGTVVHQDYGLSADDYEENIAAYGTDEARAQPGASSTTGTRWRVSSSSTSGGPSTWTNRSATSR